MIRIKNIHRIAVAVKDLDAAVERYKKVFGIVPFNYGIAKAERYHWAAFELGEGQCTMEFLSPWNDPEGEVLIGKFIRERGEGLYMVTLRTEGTADETVDAMRALGIDPSWGSVAWNDVMLNASGDMAAKWQEHYIRPKEACGVLFTLATIDRKLAREPATASPEYKLPIAGTRKSVATAA
jgi:catechol 2,3-dioxygenase-like lactoylglutathione lyase family enzyme